MFKQIFQFIGIGAGLMVWGISDYITFPVIYNNLYSFFIEKKFTYFPEAGISLIYVGAHFLIFYLLIVTLSANNGGKRKET